MNRGKTRRIITIRLQSYSTRKIIYIGKKRAEERTKTTTNTTINHSLNTRILGTYKRLHSVE